MWRNQADAKTFCSELSGSYLDFPLLVVFFGQPLTLNWNSCHFLGAFFLSPKSFLLRWNLGGGARPSRRSVGGLFDRSVTPSVVSWLHVPLFVPVRRRS